MANVLVFQTLGSQVNALVIKDEPDKDHKVVIKIDDSDNEKEGVLDGEDVDSEMDEPAVTAHKGELTRELKALGINPRQKWVRVCCFFIAMFEHFKSISEIWYLQVHESWVMPQFDFIVRGVLIWCLLRPDYTKPLNEPSWGDSDEEADSDVDMNADGVLGGEDESDEYEDDDMEEDEMVERIKAGKKVILA